MATHVDVDESVRGSNDTLTLAREEVLLLLRDTSLVLPIGKRRLHGTTIETIVVVVAVARNNVVCVCAS
jgi:hypothetical protein